MIVKFSIKISRIGTLKLIDQFISRKKDEMILLLHVCEIYDHFLTLK